MSRFLTLDPNKHGEMGWKPFDSLSYAAQDVCAPVVMAELSMLMPYYALAFARTGEGSYRLVCLQGLYAGENLVVSDAGKWRMPYIPSAYRGYPFILQPWENEGETKFVLGFDTQSGLLRETPDIDQGELTFFGPETGQPSEKVQGLLTFLNQRLQNELKTQKAVDLLAQAEVLQPMRWGFESPDPDRALVKGFFGVDEKKLAALSPQQLSDMQVAGALLLAHSQLLSIPRVGMIKRLSELAISQPAASLDDVEALFGGADDTLKFDF
ncbi:SapC family protein [Marinobacterium litorale]|uniref:SapC family protein n=1 Tax=Marinobacterium litorale TaxID=404770 RepID=UPI000409E47B|nr:SapC family protein [Marinobacterium litorale]